MEEPKTVSMYEYPPHIVYRDSHEYLDAIFYKNYEFGKCATRAEEAFLIGFLNAFGVTQPREFGGCMVGLHVIKPQILVGQGTEWYRVGFRISECLPAYEDVKTSSDCEEKVVVECGGDVDLKRDRRILELTGMPTMRFTEDEVFEDPINCAVQVIDALHVFTNKKRKAFRDGRDFAFMDIDSED